VYAVNDLSFHPYMTFATIGSDGCYHFWDKDQRTRLKQSQPLQQSLSAGAFSKDGNLFAYAASYDWARVNTVILTDRDTVPTIRVILTPSLYMPCRKQK
jgi:WD40 repeat protein